MSVSLAGFRLKECAQNQQQQESSSSPWQQSQALVVTQGWQSQSTARPQDSTLCTTWQEPALQGKYGTPAQLLTARQGRLSSIWCTVRTRLECLMYQYLAQNWLDLKDADFHYNSLCAFLPSPFSETNPRAAPLKVRLSHSCACLCHLYFPSSNQQEFWKKWSPLKWIPQLPKRNLLLCLRMYSSVKYRNATLTFCLLRKHPWCWRRGGGSLFWSLWGSVPWNF